MDAPGDASHSEALKNLSADELRNRIAQAKAREQEAEQKAAAKDENARLAVEAALADGKAGSRGRELGPRRRVRLRI